MAVHALVGAALVLPWSTAAFTICLGPSSKLSSSSNIQGQQLSRTRRRRIARSSLLLWSQVEESSTVSSSSTTSTTTSLFHNDPIVAVHTLTLKEHRPLGCTVEESLAVEDDQAVFVASVKEGGFAHLAGLQVGDVIIGVTGLFGGEEIIDESVAGRIDKVKQLVAARPDAEPLQLRVARETAVLARHEAALAELCANPASDDDDATEQCMLEYLQSGYYNEQQEDEDAAAAAAAAAALSLQQQDDDDNDDEICNPDEDEDCVLDDLHNLWAEDLPEPVKSVPSDSSFQDDDDSNNNNPAVKPWSSRASPSGTWVRDPTTGEMRNIS